MTEGTSTAAISIALPPSKEFPEYARHAERLGYSRVWAFDSPALYTDIWIALARAAEATNSIGLGTGVAIPSLRHVMVTASAIASIEELAPGRLVVALGTGFTARNTMGKRGMRWADLELYANQLRGLLHGDVVMVDDGACQMIHSAHLAPARPIQVPVLLAPIGPKGMAAARRSGDGAVLVGLPAEPPEPSWGICALLASGTVLRPGEDHTSERVRDAGGPIFVTSYHGVWEWAPAAVAGMPGGTEWLARIGADRVEGQRHLAVHEGHFANVNRTRPPVARRRRSGDPRRWLDRHARADP